MNEGKFNIPPRESQLSAEDAAEEYPFSEFHRKLGEFGSAAAAKRAAEELRFVGSAADHKYKIGKTVNFLVDHKQYVGTIKNATDPSEDDIRMYEVEYVDTSGRLTRVVLKENELMMEGGRNRRISKKHRKSKHRKSKHRKSKHRKSKHRKSKHRKSRK